MIGEIIGIAHLGMLPKDPVKCRYFFHEVLGLPISGEESVPSQQVDVVMIGLPSPTARLEILTPTSAESSLQKFLDKRSGVHHIALEVKNIKNVLEHLKKSKIRLIDDEPRDGADHTRVAFVHPEGTGGILIELVEKAD